MDTDHDQAGQGKAVLCCAVMLSTACAASVARYTCLLSAHTSTD